MTITLMIVFFLGGIFAKYITSNKINELSKNTEELTQIVAEHKTELADNYTQITELLSEDYSTLEDGAYYWGTTDDLMRPNGFGILKKDDIYYIGNFEHGEKYGMFSIINNNEAYRMEYTLGG